MTATTPAPDVVVVGGGIIGLAVAAHARARGMSVTVVDAGEPGAWQYAAGMLAPVTEAEFGEEVLLRLGLESAALYPDFAAALGGCGYRDAGTLLVARDRDEAEAIDRLHAFRTRLGLPAERLLPTAARRAEPALAPTVRPALHVAGDRAGAPRQVVAALARDVVRARVTALRVQGERVEGVELSDGRVLRAGQVVLAAGAWSDAIAMPDAARVPVRPVKGQVLRLRDPHGPGLVERSIRTPQAYLVPRADGGYVLGATMEERGWDTAPTAGAMLELLRDLSEVVPGVLELEVEGIGAGLRPATPDNLPALGRGALDGLVWATGHFRNGVLLAPITGQLVAAVLAGEELPEWAAACDARRFAPVPA